MEIDEYNAEAMPLSTIVEDTEGGNETKLTSRPTSFLKTLEKTDERAEKIRSKKNYRSRKSKHSTPS